MEIPPVYRGKSLQNFDDHSAKVDAAMKAVHIGQSLFLTGNTGTGKTHLGVALMNRWYACRFNGHRLRGIALFLPALEFFAALKNTFGDSSTSEDSVLTRYSSTEFLLIDDVGAEKISDWSRQAFFTLIDRRYRNKLQTIITSNLDLNQVAEMIDDRISSRVLEMGPVLRLEADDRRLVAAGQRSKVDPLSR
jgi:DNA replication protein DnaC